MTVIKRKDHDLKKSYQLSFRWMEVLPELTEPTLEQKEWAIRKMKSPSRNWEKWNK
jgi:hypothetical protein